MYVVSESQLIQLPITFVDQVEWKKEVPYLFHIFLTANITHWNFNAVDASKKIKAVLLDKRRYNK
jgi:hypothetical protein